MSRDKIQFPNWVPPEAQEICTSMCSFVDLHKKVKEVFKRLATRDEMQVGWAELKHFADVSPNQLMMWTVGAWICSTQHSQFFNSNRVDRELASMIRAVLKDLRTFGSEMLELESISDATLRELERVTAFYEQRAERSDPLLRIAPPPRKALDRNADKTAFLYQICNWLGERRTGRRQPYELVAILVNVAFDLSDSQYDADKVKQCLRARLRKGRKKLGNISRNTHCNVHRLN